MKIADKLSTLLFYLCIFVFIVALEFPHNPAGNWYQQFMPNLNGRTIVDITFTDSLTGYAVTSLPSLTDTAFILKTTNSGDNWVINHRDSAFVFRRIQFINQNTGFAGGTHFMKTTNAGNNWQLMSQSLFFDDMFVLNNDTAWFAKSENLTGGVFFTFNGGANWQNQINLGSQNPNHIYMYNARIGFICEDNVYLRKTTNGGASWSSPISGENGFTDMYFIDSLTGWKCSVFGMKKTTNGGLNWVTQILPSGGIIQTNGISSFSNISKDTIWANGGYVLFPNNQIRSILNRTTNGGDTWRFQIPDTSIKNIGYTFVNFVNKQNGWGTDYMPTRGEIHTTNGGDTVWYTGIIQINNSLPKEYELKQNYPNPFNPRTVIPFSLKRSAYVKLIAYDITGREIQKMVEGKYSAGEYEADFMGKFTASGVYFYRMEVTDDASKQLYTEVKKMILLK
jgi:photosystem II stability/assembly factor-like uncharacterized protein